MIEPTETESKEEMDVFIESVHEIYQTPKKHDHGAQQTFVTGIDETGAARNPQLTWHW